ncbi:hypothetical protein GCM10010245_27010 [Streptomyces spectabilis]|nr:hypothetical protein GCM10010245_27010 [Streptomyces spectabilis]
MCSRNDRRPAGIRLQDLRGVADEWNQSQLSTLPPTGKGRPVKLTINLAVLLAVILRQAEAREGPVGA